MVYEGICLPLRPFVAYKIACEGLKESYRLQIAGADFFRADFEKTEEGKTIYEAFICARRKGSFVSWSFVSLSPAALEQIASSVQSVSFH